jgi:uncharacterized membrane protein YfcA
MIGLLAGLLGIGGGILTVPYLLRLRLSFVQAAALGVAFSFTAAIVATISWYLIGYFIPSGLHAFNVGYVNSSAMLFVAGSGVISAYFTSKWSEKIPVNILRSGFAILLLLFALQKCINLVINYA